MSFIIYFLKNNMKNKIIITTFIILVLSLYSCDKNSKNNQEIYFKTWSVLSWSLNSQVNFIWYTDSFNKTDYWAKMWWRITSINFNEWDYVKQWDLIATLDWQEAKTSISSTKEVINSLNILKNQTIKMYDEQIEASKSKINQINTWLEIAELQISQANNADLDVKDISKNQLKTIKSQIDSAETWLQTAKLNLENSIENLKQKESIIYSNSKSSISWAIIIWDNIIDFLDNIFWLTEKNKKKNDDFENFIWAKDNWQKLKNEKLINDFIKDFYNLKSKYNQVWGNEDIKKLLEDFNNLYSNYLRLLLKESYLTMQNSVSSSNFSDATINSYKNQIANFQSQNEQIILNVSWNYIIGLKWSLDNINNYDKEYKTTTDLLSKQVDLAQKQVDVLNQTYNQYSSVWNSQINDVFSKVEIAKKQKDSLNNQIIELNLNINALNEQKKSKIKEIETQISQTNASLNNSEVLANNSKIFSSTSWVVVKKYAEIWQVIWAWNPVISIANNNDIKIVIYLSDEEISKININDKVTVKIDGFDKSTNWVITNILPTKDKITKKNIIEIKISNDDKKIKLWSYTKVYLKNNSSAWLIIPNSSIINNYMQPWVYILENNKVIFKNITIIRNDDENSLIEWLKENQTIIISWWDYLYDWMNINNNY